MNITFEQHQAVTGALALEIAIITSAYNGAKMEVAREKHLAELRASEHEIHLGVQAREWREQLDDAFAQLSKANAEIAKLKAKKPAAKK